MFTTVIAGIDGTRASFEAGRQAARLTAPGGRLVLFAAADDYMAMYNQWGPGPVISPGRPGEMVTFEAAKARLRELARDAVQAVRDQLPADLDVTMRVEPGRPWDALRRAATAEAADLVVFGSHGGRRLAGIALGSTATEMIHDATSAVMVARTPFDPGRFPASVVVGLDGSEHSIAALDAVRAWTAASSGEVSVRCVAARGSGLGAEGLARLAEPFRCEVSEARPVEALLEAALSADLLVVGARGLSGVRALGSVSERLAHRAECSVLIVPTS